MTKTTKSNKAFTEKIARYSALSLAIAGIADASGQVNFTDVDPDVTAVSANTEAILIDLDGDGTNDIRVGAGISDTGSMTPFTVVDNSNNTLTGLVITQTLGGYNYAINLPSGATISSGTGDFNAAGSLCYGNGGTDTFCGQTGSVPSGFVGIQFDISGSVHFGWIALENVSGNEVTVTGYAYEETAGASIEAGDQEGLLSAADNQLQQLSFTVSNDQLNVRNDNPLQNIQLFNVLGQEVLSQRLEGNNESINISNLSSGVYIATVTSEEGASRTIKIAKR